MRSSLLATALVSLMALIVFLRRPPSVIHFRESSWVLLLTLQTLSFCLSAVALWRWLRTDAPPIAPPIALRVGVYCLLAGTVTYLGFFQPFKALFFLFYWGCWSGCYPLLLLLGPRLAVLVPRRWLRGFDLTLFNLGLLLVGGELVLSLAAVIWPIPLFATESNSALDVIAQHRFPPGHRHLGFPCDSRGNYDHEPGAREASRLITAIGDSFSVGVVPHYFHYTTVCERQLQDTEIYNIGVSAVGPPEYLHLLREEALPLRPQAVLLGLFVGNDVHESIRFRPSFPWLRRWFDQNDTLLWLVPKRLLRIARERERQGPALGVAPVQDEAPSARIDSTPAELASVFPWVADPTLEKPTFSETTFLEIEQYRAFGLCDPTQTTLFENLFEVLGEIRKAAAPIPLLILMIPDELQVEDRLWNQIVDGPLRGRTLERDRPQRLIGRWLADQGIPALDLLPVFRAQPTDSDGQRHLYHLRDTHLNARGNRVAGETLAGFLQEQLVAPGPVSEVR